MLSSPASTLLFILLLHAQPWEEGFTEAETEVQRRSLNLSPSLSLFILSKAPCLQRGKDSLAVRDMKTGRGENKSKVMGWGYREENVRTRKWLGLQGDKSCKARRGCPTCTTDPCPTLEDILITELPASGWYLRLLGLQGSKTIPSSGM